MYPILLECDRLGQVLWLSDRARSVLGDINNLAHALAPSTILVESRQEPATFCVSKIYEAEGRILLSLQRGQATDISAASSLSRLEERFRDHFFRLVGAERALSGRVRQNKGSGRTTIRQIERERQRLGRDLHTGVGQVLAAIRLQLETIVKQLPNPPSPVQLALDRIATLAGEALEQVRWVSRLLHPPEWQRLTIDAALAQLWEISGVPQHFDGGLQIDTPPREPDPEVKALIYRAAQEGLSNLAQHSRATHVSLTLETRGNQVVLTLSDDGVGFDVAAQLAAPPNVAAGLGLRSIREQAAALGGTVEIASGPKGTTLIVSAPFALE